MFTKSMLNKLNRIATNDREQLSGIQVANGRAYVSDGCILYTWPTKDKDTTNQYIPTNYPKLVPQSFNTTVKVSSFHVEQAARSCKAVMREDSGLNPVRIHVNGTMDISALSSAWGHQTETIIKNGDVWKTKRTAAQVKRNEYPTQTAVYQKDGLDQYFGIQVNFLMDIIPFLGADTFTLQIDNPLGALLFTAENERQVLVMPYALGEDRPAIHYEPEPKGEEQSSPEPEPVREVGAQSMTPSPDHFATEKVKEHTETIAYYVAEGVSLERALSMVRKGTTIGPKYWDQVVENTKDLKPPTFSADGAALEWFDGLDLYGLPEGESRTAKHHGHDITVYALKGRLYMTSLSPQRKAAGRRSMPSTIASGSTKAELRGPFAHWVTERKRKEDSRQRKAAERKAKNASAKVKVGDIFARSWGYDQTNADFYEVVELKGKTLCIIRELKQKHVNDALTQVMPCPGEYAERYQPKTCKIQVGYQGKTSIKVNNYDHAHNWDGKPMHVTDPYSGH